MSLHAAADPVVPVNTPVINLVRGDLLVEGEDLRIVVSVETIDDKVKVMTEDGERLFDVGTDTLTVQ